MYLNYCKPLFFFMLACFLSCSLACLTTSAEDTDEIAPAEPRAKSYSSGSKPTASRTGEVSKKNRVVKTKLPKRHSAKTRVPKLQATKLPVPKGQATKPLPLRTMTVIEWFDKYDQIRRDAEMTMADKWQSMLLQARKPEPKNAALATRMSTKYSCALSAMKKLGSRPETKALQVGYIEYFLTARQLFEDYLVAQKAVPFTNKALVPTKKKLEILDKKNKKIDDALRREYIIKKHKHS